MLIEELTPLIFNIEESKAIGSLDQPLTARDLALALKRMPKRLQMKKKKELAKASKLQKSLAKQMNNELLKLANDYLDKESPVSFSRLERGSEAIIRQTYKKVFDAAMKVSKVSLIPSVDIITSKEQKWIKSAINEELRYWKLLLKKLREGRLSGKGLERRIQAYADTVRSVYDSARVLATPSQVLINWVDRGDKRVCKSCAYLRKLSPFTKHKLPTVPRAGSTLCLSNCRCQIIIKNVSFDAITKRDKQLPSKATMLRQLRRIKQSKGRKNKREDVEMFTLIPAMDVAEVL